VRRFVNCVAALPLNVIKFLIFMQMICTQAAMPFNPYPCHMLPLTPVLPTISWCMPKLLVSCCLIFQVLAAECFIFCFIIFFLWQRLVCVFFFVFCKCVYGSCGAQVVDTENSRLPSALHLLLMNYLHVS